MNIPTIKTVIFRITLVIAVVEIFIMLSLSRVEHMMSDATHALLDTVILVLFSTPIIYLWIIKPYVMARDEAIEQVTHLALHDPLTQLANRRLMEEYLEKLLYRIKRTRVYGAILFIDLDGFKAINDRHGHHEGDSILIEVANRLQASVRGSDVVARLGGDEFVLLLSELGTEQEISEQNASIIAKRILQAISTPVQFRETYLIGGSIGIRMLDGSDTSAEQLIEEADMAMYSAKQGAKGKIQFFENLAYQPGMNRSKIA